MVSSLKQKNSLLSTLESWPLCQFLSPSACIPRLAQGCRPVFWPQQLPGRVERNRGRKWMQGIEWGGDRDGEIWLWLSFERVRGAGRSGLWPAEGQEDTSFQEDAFQSDFIFHEMWSMKWRIFNLQRHCYTQISSLSLVKSMKLGDKMSWTDEAINSKWR